MIKKKDVVEMTMIKILTANNFMNILKMLFFRYYRTGTQA